MRAKTKGSKDSIFLCMIFLVVLGVVLFAFNYEAKAAGRSKFSNTTATILALQGAPKFPDDEDESVFNSKTIPFYIITALLILALPFEIYFLTRNRSKEKLAKGTTSKPLIFMTLKEQETPQKKKRLSRNEMSELLKASATQSKRKVTQELKPSEMTDANQEHQAENDHSAETNDTESIETSGTEEKIWLLKEPAFVEPLQQSSDDELLYESLLNINNEDAMVREKAANILGNYNTQNSVLALTNIVMNDTDVNVKLAAVHSLQHIAHESVFPALFVAMAENEVKIRNVAVRALSELKFDIADSMVRAIQMDNEEIIQKMAQACIISGLDVKALSQLTSQNKKNAYSSYTFLLLLAKAREIQTIMNAISTHEDMNVRVICVRVMNEAQKPEVTEKLREMSENESLPSIVRASLIQAVQQQAQA